MPHQQRQCIRCQVGIRIYAQHVLRVGLHHTIIECRSLATIWLGQHFYFIIALKCSGYYLICFVLTAIVYKYDVKVWIGAFQQIIYRAYGIYLFIISRHYNAYTYVTSQRRE